MEANFFLHVQHSNRRSAELTLMAGSNVHDVAVCSVLSNFWFQKWVDREQHAASEVGPAIHTDNIAMDVPIKLHRSGPVKALCDLRGKAWPLRSTLGNVLGKYAVRTLVPQLYTTHPESIVCVRRDHEPLDHGEKEQTKG